MSECFADVHVGVCVYVGELLEGACPAIATNIGHTVLVNKCVLHYSFTTGHECE